MFYRNNIYKLIKHNWLLSIILLLYVVLLLIIIPKHEPWADEAQAWLLARDSSVFELLFKNLRYEGSPGLWHLILMLPSRFIDYNYFGYITMIFAVAGIVLYLYILPFPLWIKILLPFSYFFLYQYAVISRCYVLFLIFLPLLAHFYPVKTEKPLLYAVLLILLANVNLHGFIISGILFCDFLIAVIKKNKIINRTSKRKILTATILIIINIVFVIVQIYPASDISFSPKGFAIDFEHLIKLANHNFMELFTAWPWLSYIVLFISMVWFWNRRVIVLYLLLNISLLILFSIYFNIWHQGVLFLIWVFCIAIGLNNEGIITKKLLPVKILEKSMSIAILITLIFHIYWSAIIYKNDYIMDYSAGKKISEFIVDNNLEDKKIYTTYFWAISILPYFEKNIFMSPEYEKGKSFWIWKKSNDFSETPDKIIEKQPDLIIFSRPRMFWYPEKINGYKRIEIAKGIVFWKDTIKEENDFRIFIKQSCL